ncbi:MAG: hypothetical protein Q9159_003911 [Coniocarpon cinnabarinum]
MSNPPPDASTTLALANLARDRALRTIAVPTSDPDVRAALRRLAEPITLFGEDPSLRRDRLRRLTLARQEAQEGDGDVDMLGGTPEDEEEKEKEEEFYTEAGPELLDARKSIARWSLKRSARAVAFQRNIESAFAIEDHRAVRNGVKEELKGFELWGSQTAPRPVSVVRFPNGYANPSPDVLAVGDWSGEVRILSVPDLETRRSLRGHQDKIRGLAWHPQSRGLLDSGGVKKQPLDIATGGSEGSVHLWSLDPQSDEDVDMTADDSTAKPTPKPQSNDLKPLHTIQPPLDPDPASRAIRSLSFHPSGEYLAIASEDTTFHLYSLHQPPTIPTTSLSPSASSTAPQLDPTNLATHDAHTHAPHTLTFSPNGSLLLSGGADAHGRIWDLRTGRTIMLLSGHMREIHSSSWAPDGFRAITGSADGFGILWDVRMVREWARLPLHNRGVTDTIWFHGNGREGVLGAMNGHVNGNGEGNGDGGGEAQIPAKAGTFILSAGFDKELAFTSPDDGVPIKRLQGHNGHVLSCDATGDGKWVGSGGYDRTIKIWGVS